MKDPIILPLENIDSTEILYNFQGCTNDRSLPVSLQDASLKVKAVEYCEYEKAFKLVQKELVEGNSYLCNLTFETPISISLSLQEIYAQSRAKYKLWIKNRFTVFSPEIFVQIHNNSIKTFPMKGTIDSAVSDARKKILADTKELAEHITIVDLLRNDLNMIAQNVTVKRFRYIDEIRTSQKHLLQVSSEICGTLEENWQHRLGHIIYSLLPAGSVTGAPKKKTLEIIQEAETHRRGYYTGIMGRFDGNQLDSAVMIRFIEQREGQLYYKSGGGITIYSDCHKEYQEMIDKIYIPSK